jgi:energy-converting hydrogenase Eha subunit A
MKDYPWRLFFDIEKGMLWPTPSIAVGVTPVLREDTMETLGFLGFTLGSTGVTFALIAWGQIAELRKSLTT